jgi:hypothetical protein
MDDSFTAAAKVEGDKEFKVLEFVSVKHFPPATLPICDGAC